MLDSSKILVVLGPEDRHFKGNVVWFQPEAYDVYWRRMFRYGNFSHGAYLPALSYCLPGSLSNMTLLAKTFRCLTLNRANQPTPSLVAPPPDFKELRQKQRVRPSSVNPKWWSPCRNFG
jgi:hypothetical protein